MHISCAGGGWRCKLADGTERAAGRIVRSNPPLLLPLMCNVPLNLQLHMVVLFLRKDRPLTANFSQCSVQPQQSTLGLGSLGRSATKVHQFN